MKTLEVKDLKYYLGTGLQWTLQGLRIFTMSGLSEETLHTEEGSVLTWPKHTDLPQALFPCFIPLSALIEQLPDGSTPIVELLNIAYERIFHYRLTSSDTEIVGSENEGYGCIIIEDNERVAFTFDLCNGQMEFMLSIDHSEMSLNQLQLFEYLYQYHFWLGDQSLFETGEIIDKRTLK